MNYDDRKLKPWEPGYLDQIPLFPATATTLAQLLTDNQQNAELTLEQRRQVVAANKRQPESNNQVSNARQ